MANPMDILVVREGTPAAQIVRDRMRKFGASAVIFVTDEQFTSFLDDTFLLSNAGNCITYVDEEEA